MLSSALLLIEGFATRSGVRKERLAPPQDTCPQRQGSLVTPTSPYKAARAGDLIPGTVDHVLARNGIPGEILVMSERGLLTETEGCIGRARIRTEYNPNHHGENDGTDL